MDSISCESCQEQFAGGLWEMSQTDWQITVGGLGKKIAVCPKCDAKYKSAMAALLADGKMQEWIEKLNNYTWLK